MDIISMLLIYWVGCVVFLKSFELAFMDLMVICLFACVACLLWIIWASYTIDSLLETHGWVPIK
jgi:hypothetical protein